MRKLAIAAVMLGLLVPAFGQPEPGKLRGGPRSDAPNEVAIRKRYDDFQAAWNRRDAKAMASMWAVDGDHMDPDGRMAKGRREVEHGFEAAHKTVFKDTTLALSISSVWFVTANVALIEGQYKLAGARDSKGAELPPLNGFLTAVLMKEGDEWWVAASRLMRPVPLEYRPE